MRIAAETVFGSLVVSRTPPVALTIALAWLLASRAPTLIAITRMPAVARSLITDACVTDGPPSGPVEAAISIASGLPDDGRLTCCDVSEEWTAIARDHWKRNGVDDRIELRIAPAVETLQSLPDEPSIDFAFIDADKPSYVAYYEALIPRLRSRGVLMVDNVLWGGRVIDPTADDGNTVAIRKQRLVGFNLVEARPKRRTVRAFDNGFVPSFGALRLVLFDLTDSNEFDGIKPRGSCFHGPHDFGRRIFEAHEQPENAYGLRAADGCEFEGSAGSWLVIQFIMLGAPGRQFAFNSDLTFQDAFHARHEAFACGVTALLPNEFISRAIGYFAQKLH